MKLQTILIVLFSLLVLNTFAQKKIITGNIKSDETLQPLFGVVVTLEGTKNGVITDLDGNYNVEVKKGDVLVFSFSGYEDQVIEVQNQDKIDVILETKKTRKEKKRELEAKENKKPTKKRTVEKRKEEKKKKKRGYIYGKVVSGKTGWELLGVQVLATYSKLNALTDFEGSFELKADSGEIITYYMPGYHTKTIILGNEKEFQIELIKMASFPGGKEKLHAFISKNLRYPVEALEDEIEGTVYVKFTIEPDGSATNIAVTRSVNPLLDEEAIRIVKKMPKWEPAYKGTKPISSVSSIHVAFKKQQ